tara:strand:+ start:3423 stop:3968 length:546 start_codon:yes stop_codon:yes gene_type:complete
MNLNSPNPIINTPQQLFLKKQTAVDDINNRMTNRNYPDVPLQPNYNPRPISTKYALFPMYNGRKPMHETHMKYPSFQTNSNFYPGTQNGPVQGFTDNIDLETILRNQTTRLQHGASQGIYIPSSNSDLYNVQLSEPSVKQQQPHPGLFKKEQYEAKSETNFHPEIGNNMFSNHTRTQLRNT